MHAMRTTWQLHVANSATRHRSHQPLRIAIGRDFVPLATNDQSRCSHERRIVRKSAAPRVFEVDVRAGRNSHVRKDSPPACGVAQHVQFCPLIENALLYGRFLMVRHTRLEALPLVPRTHEPGWTYGGRLGWRSFALCYRAEQDEA